MMYVVCTLSECDGKGNCEERDMSRMWLITAYYMMTSRSGLNSNRERQFLNQMRLVYIFPSYRILLYLLGGLSLT